MSTIAAKVVNRTIEITDKPILYSFSANVDDVQFTFDEEWTGFEKTAVFYRDPSKPYGVILSGDKATIPPEVMEERGRMAFGVYGAKDNKIITSEIVFYDIGTGAFIVGEPTEEMQDLWHQILAQMADIKQVGANLEANVTAAKTAADTATAKAAEATAQATAAAGSATTATAQANIAKEQAVKAEEAAIELTANIQDVSALAIVETAKGESVNVNDASDASLHGLRIYGKAYQDTTPSKNLSDVANVEISGSQTVTFGKEIPAGTYTISAVVTSTDTDTTECLMLFYYTDSTTKEVSIKRSTGDARVSTTTTFDKAVNKVRIYAADNHGNSTGDTASVKDLQIEAGSTATAYEPYDDGTPSSENQKPITVAGSGGAVNIRIFGANILPPTNGDSRNVFIKKGTKVYWVAKEGTTSQGGNVYFNKKNGETVWFGASKGTTENTITLPDDVYKITNLLTDYLHVKIAVFIGEKREYVPFTEQSIPLSTPNGLPAVPVTSGGNYVDETGQQWISDYVDCERGKYVKCVEKYIFDGDTEVFLNTNPHYFQIATRGILANINPAYKYGMLCNLFSEQNGNDLWANNLGDGISYSNSGENVRIRYNSASTAEEFKQFLSEHNVIVYVRLATPVETDLSAEEIAAYKALHTNKLVTNVFSDADPQVGIEMDYAADPKTYIDRKFDALATAILNTGE